MSISDESRWIQVREEVIAGLRDGVEALLMHFYNEHFPAVYRYVFNRVDRDHADAEEIVGEVFYQAFRDIGSYKATHAPGAWLKGIARHRLVDAMRKKGRRKGVEVSFNRLGSQAVESIQDIASQELPEAFLEQKETAQLVEQVLSELPPEYEQVLRLRYLEEQRVKAIAEKLDITEKSAESRLFRARNAFREVFQHAVRETGSVYEGETHG